MIELQKIKDLFKNLEFEVQIDEFIVPQAESDINIQGKWRKQYLQIYGMKFVQIISPYFLGRRDKPLLVAADYITSKIKGNA